MPTYVYINSPLMPIVYYLILYALHSMLHSMFVAVTTPWIPSIIFIIFMIGIPINMHAYPSASAFSLG